MILQPVKKGLFCLLLMIAGSLSSFAQADSWVQKNDFGGTLRQGAVGFSIDGKGYLGTGNDGNLTKDFWEYDPVADAWTQKADFGGIARTHATGFSIGSKGYLGTGVDNIADIYYKDFWEYDPAVNTWTQKADFRGAARKNAVGFGIGDRGYLGTGYDGINASRDIWEYDPIADTWVQKADFGGIGRYRAVGFSIGSKGYLSTGFDGTSNDMKDFWEYDPGVDTWTQKTDFGGTAREKAVGFSIGTKGYLGTGNNGSTNFKDLWEYDPDAGIWTRKADFGGTGRRYAAGFSIGNNAYLGTGGETNNLYRDFWEYTPDIVLPLRLISFNGIFQKTTAVLNWQTANDINVSHFNIQRSFNGGNLTTIAKQNAAGSSTTQQYLYSDENVEALQQSTVFYRLQMVNSDGSFTYSNIIRLKVNNSNIVFFNIYPNPGKGNFVLQMQLPPKAASTMLSLYNNFGEKVWLQDAGLLSGSVNRNIAFDTKLPAGVYELVVQSGDTRLMQKVVVTK